MALIPFLAASVFLWAAALPLAARLFRRFPDAGAGLAFPLGALLAGTAYFLLRTASVLESGRGGYLVVAGALALAGLWALGAHRRTAMALASRWRRIGAILLLFLTFFLAFAFYRSFLPDIAGTEQPMDFMYLNATIASPSYPPEDPWLAEEPASYYYLGYVEAGFLTELSGVPPATGYNLALAWLFGAAAAATWSVAHALGRAALAGARKRWPAIGAGLAVVLVLGSGSLIATFEWAGAHERYDRTLYETFGAEAVLPCPPASPDVNVAEPHGCYEGPSPRTTAWYPTEFWFWFDDTRTIPGTITEFPAFSFLLGDLHPHVMAIPLVLLAVALAFARWRSRRLLSVADLVRDPAGAVLTAIILGGLAFQNTWDVITFAGLFALATGGRAFCSGGRRGLAQAISAFGLLVALALVVYLPWAMTFSSQAAGLYSYAGAGTKPSHAFLQFGPVAIPALTLLAWAGARNRDSGRSALMAGLGLPLGLLLAWALLALLRGDLLAALSDRGSGWFTAAGYAAAVAAFLTLLARSLHRRASTAPALALGALGLLLLFGTELFFIRDLFFASVPRMNTVFKLSYQAWLVLAVTGGVGLAGALRAAARRPLAALLGTAGMGIVLGSLVFPLIAIPNRTDGFSGPWASDLASLKRGLDSILEPEGLSLNGLSAVAHQSPEEYALVRWIGASVRPGEIVVEATGRRWGRGGDGGLVLVSADVDYGESGRISARTGRPSPVGWYFHEVQWRGDGVREELDRRQQLVDAVYTASDATTALQALRALDASYVVVGSIERSRYPADVLTDFGTFLELVWEEGSTSVYRIPQYELVTTS